MPLATGSEIVLLDITAVPVVDTAVAEHLEGRARTAVDDGARSEMVRFGHDRADLEFTGGDDMRVRGRRMVLDAPGHARERKTGECEAQDPCCKDAERHFSNSIWNDGAS